MRIEKVDFLIKAIANLCILTSCKTHHWLSNALITVIIFWTAKSFFDQN